MMHFLLIEWEQDDYTHEEAAEPASILLGWRNEVLNLLETLRSEK